MVLLLLVLLFLLHAKNAIIKNAGTNNLIRFNSTGFNNVNY